jgi:AAA+ superfamily predicted ATPase/L-amino acid N-acyltransferase YncA
MLTGRPTHGRSSDVVGASTACAVVAIAWRCRIEHQAIALPMADWVIREMVGTDLDAAVRVWDDSGINASEPVFSIAEVAAALAEGDPAVVAEVAGRVVGTACSILDGDRAWVVRLALAADWRNRGIGSELLMALEERLTGRGVTRLSALLHEGEVGDAAFANQAYDGPTSLRYYDRRESYAANHAQIVAELGGRIIPPTAWSRLSGGEDTKALIERMLVQPLAEPVLAERLGLRPPGAAILFGPPGTGKTSLVRGVAGRLGWPFIEVFPAQLGTTASEIAAGIRSTFERLQAVEHAVVFIDEVDEVAARRQEASAAQAITNELLKVIPGFRNRTGRLLICATNSISRLDAAFVRTGRFDFILPVGPPDLLARTEALTTEVERITDQPVDVSGLAAATAGYTMADLDHLLRTAAQLAFERALSGDEGARVTQADIESALDATKPSVMDADMAVFAEEIERYARM